MKAARPGEGSTNGGTVALEVIDGGLLAVAAGGALGPPSPGYAVAEGGELFTGRLARSRSRLSPRRTHSRFWQPLDDTPLPRPFPRRWTHTDLAHRHLADLRRELAIEPERVIVAAPGDTAAGALARLLGIAAAAGWPVVGLVDSAVAAFAGLAAAAGDASPRATRGSDFEEADGAWHLDLGLHRTVLSELAVERGVARRRVLVGEVGVVDIERGWARLFARRLVRATRFDPLHSAASEQRLYDAMGGWLEELRSTDGVEAVLADGGREHRVDVSRAEVEAAAGDAYAAIAALFPAPLDAASSLLVSHRAARLPGLAAALSPIGGRLHELPPTAAAAGALELEDLLAADAAEPSFVVRLPERARGAA